MRPAHVIEIKTPKGVLLNGLWFGPKKPKKALVFVHGLMSTAFSMRRAIALVDAQTAVITFNNRGFGLVNSITRVSGKKTEWILAGCAHEVFTDCVDDIAGAIGFVRAQGVRSIWLAGHSTGCQKSVYYAARTKSKHLKGLMLFAPISDYAAYLHQDNKNGSHKKALAAARKLVAAGRPHEMLPAKISGEFQCDAQRFLSLYTPDSEEEIFTYAHDRAPTTLERVRSPILVLLAEQDEYADRPAAELAGWFLEHIYEGEVVVVPEVDHGFKGAEEFIRKAVARFVKGG